MKLIADSGSTKTTWAIIGPASTEYVTTGGMNPFFRTTEDIQHEFETKVCPLINSEVTEIFFYGAGVINDEKGKVVADALKSKCPKAKIETHSDLLATARATLGKNKGLACILGTGSNSCLYDGNSITMHVPPLGFILGDEGSGAVLGRKLVADYLKGIMPENLAVKFRNKFPLNYAGLMEGIYRKERPNQFLATFVPFLSENISDFYCTELVENAFDEFISRNLARYPGYQRQPVCFAGSVAFYFQNQLKKAAEKNRLQLKSIVKEPMPGLIAFHSK